MTDVGRSNLGAAILNHLPGTVRSFVETHLVPGSTPRWKVSKAILQWLSTCRFSILTAVVVSFVLFWADQAQDALRAIAVDRDPARVAFFVGSAIFWAYSSFYFPRILLRFDYPGDLTFDDDPAALAVQRCLVKHGPRVLGIAPLVVLGLAIGAPSKGHSLFATPESRALGGLMFALAVVFGAFLWFRRALLRLKADDPRKPTTLCELPSATKIYLGIHAAVFVVSFFSFVWGAVGTGQRLGPLTILLVATSAWIWAGSLITYFGRWRQLPILTLIVAWSTFCARFNDNHDVFPPPPETPAQPAVEVTLEDDFQTWYSDLASANGDKPPWFIVATEGGGIRAAYWTAAVLSQIEKNAPGFKRHLYAISGVSGGSVGSGVFVSLLAAGESGQTLVDDASATLGGDFLSPILAKGLYGDVLQRVWPWPIQAFDRGTALEEAWTKAMAPRSDLLGMPFASFWREFPKLPRLFLNATIVETGQRAVVSYPTLARTVQPDPVPDAVDVERSLGRVSLVQAMHLSARFTWVSPAGLFKHPTAAPTKDMDVVHVVDGGYFENSGAGTAQDIVRHLAATGKLPRNPIYLVIQYDDAPGPPPEWSTDLLSPVRVMLNARTARATLAINELRGEGPNALSFADVQSLRDSLKPVHLEFQLEPTGSLPLGWALSRQARADMDSQARRFMEKAPAEPAAEPALPIGLYPCIAELVKAPEARGKNSGEVTKAP